jgi:hypothetical protein
MNLSITFSSSPSPICPWPTAMRAFGPAFAAWRRSPRWCRCGCARNKPGRRGRVPFDGRLDQLLIPIRDDRLNRHAIFGRRLDHAHVAQSHQRHVQRARNRRRRHRQHVDLVRICLSRSLWRTPKRCSSSTTSSPRSLNFTSFESRRCVPIRTSTLPLPLFAEFLLLLRRAEAADHFDLHGKGAKRCLKVS